MSTFWSSFEGFEDDEGNFKSTRAILYQPDKYKLDDTGNDYKEGGYESKIYNIKNTIPKIFFIDLMQFFLHLLEIFFS